MISLLVANSKEIHSSPERILDLLKNFHPDFLNVIAAPKTAFSDDNGIFLEIKWKNQHVRILEINAPLPIEVTTSCISSAMYAETFKAQIEEHVSHFMLQSLSSESNALDQYVALTAIAVSLEPLGAIAIINGTANSSFPINPLVDATSGLDQMEYFRSLPLTLFFCGTTTFQFENADILWSRTYGAEEFSLPNLAIQHQLNQDFNSITFFSEVLSYFFYNQPLLAGMTMSYGEYSFHFREPTTNENFLLQENENLLVISYA